MDEPAWRSWAEGEDRQVVREDAGTQEGASKGEEVRSSEVRALSAQGTLPNRAQEV